MSRGSWVWRDGKMVEKHLAGPARGMPDGSKRSSLAAPYITSDYKAYRSTHTGEMIEGRAAHREHLRRHGLVELGNDDVPGKTSQERLRDATRDVAADVAKAYEMLEQGYQAPPEEHISAGDAGLDGAIPATGEVVRSTAPDLTTDE